MKISATKEIRLDFQPAKIARDYIKQLRVIGKKFEPGESLMTLWKEYSDPSTGNFSDYIENLIERALPEGYVYYYEDCVELQEEVKEKILEIITKEEHI